jgi:hypothetical protein
MIPSVAQNGLRPLSTTPQAILADEVWTQLQSILREIFQNHGLKRLFICWPKTKKGFGMNIQSLISNPPVSP